MKIDILTLFPDFFDAFIAHSMIRRAIDKKIVTIRPHDLRHYTHDRHRSCDDKPFGGGPGMLMKPEPIFEAYEALFGPRGQGKKTVKPKRKRGLRFIYLTPSGKRLDQKMARSLAKEKHIALLCGHYEGVDERVIEHLVTDEVSVGDYVLTGGELPAMTLIDAVVRLLPGVLGCGQSKDIESFSRNLLEYPQYTRPADYRGSKVPPVLLSGDHKQIELWRQQEATKRTKTRRPDLFNKKPLRS